MKKAKRNAGRSIVPAGAHGTRVSAGQGDGSSLAPADPFISMIERAARDPAVDVSKMKELLAMRNDEQQRIAKQAYGAAMVEAQNGMVPIKKNIQADRFKYASLEAVDNALRPIYSRHGFALSYNSEPINDKRMLVICDVLHRAGHERRYSVPITVSTAGPKGAQVMTQTQGEGAAVSFGRRYLLLMIFNIITTEDDIAVTGAGSLVSDEQLYDLRELIKETQANLPVMCQFFGIDTLVNLPASRFAEAKAMLEAKKQQQAKKQVPA